MKNGVITLYGIDGKRLGNYTLEMVGSWDVIFAFRSVDYLGLNPPQQMWFAGRPLDAVDQVGSRSTGGRFTPYGVEVTPSANDAEKFATYYRDQKTGLDYAMQRYYQSGIGRFLTPDPYVASGGPADPQSWNRYAYVENDPINNNDPSGLAIAPVYNEGFTFSITVTAPIGSPFPVSFLPAGGPVRQPGRQPHLRPSEITEDRRSFDFSTTNARFHGQLAEALRQLASDCYKRLEELGKSSADIAATAESINFYDATTSLGNLRQDQVTGNGVSTSLINSGYGTNAYVLRDRNGALTNSVVLKPNFYGGAVGRSVEDQNTTLVHETLHVTFRMGDQDLRRHLGVPDRFGPEDSAAISAWLKEDCAGR